MDALIGRKLDGRYKIDELIGAGGMANVYKATDILENRAVAVKILREEFLDNEELVRRFKNESRAISMLSHPNIVQVYDVNFSDAVQFIVMEYIDGINFMQYLESQGRLEWKEAVHFTVQVLRALQHAHDRGIVHRDIKPQNIMVLRDGSIKVMDFGIARFSRSQTRTITDKAIGSVHYISPEQAMGEETDAKSDIYSLGVMLYEMLTGKLPFDSDSPVSVALKQISDAPQKPREIVPEIPEPLEEITLKAMAKDPEERYQSAAEMMKDIDEFKKNPSIKFEYKYLSTGEGGTKYFDAVEKSKGAAQSDAPKVSRSKNGKEKVKVPRRRGWAIPALIGVTVACFLGAIFLAYMVFTAGENSIFSKHEDVTLPDFTNMTLEEIRASEEYSQNFKFTIVEEFSNTVEAGRVTSQDPMPPITVLDNANITLYISKGVEFVTVPEITGFSYSDAFKTLADSNLAVRIETVSEGRNENEVIRTSPAAGEVVEAYTIVTVYVQKPAGGSSTLYVPNLEGLDLVTANLLLTANGMRIGEVTEEYDEEVEAGLIISQSVAANTPASLNTSVDVVVSLGPTPVGISLNISGYGSYNIAVSVNGNAITVVNGKGTVLVAPGETANVIVRITNPANNESVEYTAQITAEQGVANIDVSSVIPSEWSKQMVNFTVNITNLGEYSATVSVNGQNVNLTNGRGMIQLESGATAAVNVSITNGGEPISWSESFQVGNSDQTATINASLHIPAQTG